MPPVKKILRYVIQPNMNDKEKVFRSRVLPRRLTRAELKALNLESGIVYVKSCKKHGESAKNLEKKLTKRKHNIKLLKIHLL